MAWIEAQRPQGSFDVAKSWRLLVTILATAALLLAYLYPFHVQPWLTFYNEWLFAVFLCLGLAVQVMTGSLRLANPWPWIAVMCVLCLHYWLSGQGTVVQREGLQMTEWFLLGGWLAYTLGQNLRADERLDWILGAVWTAGMVSALLALMQWLGVFASGDWNPGYFQGAEAGGRASSNIGQANNLGTLLVIGIWSVGYAWYRDAERRPLWWRCLAVASVAVLTLGVYLSGSRTATLNLILAPVLWLAWSRWRGERLVWWAVLPIVLLGLWNVVMPQLMHWFPWLVPPEVRSLVSDHQRVRLWTMVLTAVGQRPWMGWGFGAVSHIHLVLAPVFGAFNYRIASQAHNTILDLLATFGVVLGGALVGTVVWLWARAWWRNTEPKYRYAWWMVTAVFVHAMLEYPLHYGFFFWLVFVLLGALDAKAWRAWPVRAPAVSSLAWLAVSVPVLLMLWSAYLNLETVYTVFTHRGPKTGMRALDMTESRARNLYPGLYQRLHWIMKPMDELSQLSDAQLADLDDAAQAYPLPGLVGRVATAYAYRGDAARSAWWMERFCALYTPAMCVSAQQEWEASGAKQPHWPVLPWAQWQQKNPKSAPAPATSP